MSRDGLSQMVGVDWSLLAEAIVHYGQKGWTKIDVPYLIPEYHCLITCPPENIQSVDDGRSLIGSAEQSFLYLDMIGKLPKGRFVACTPCFRPEEVTLMNRPHFMKVELYQNADVTQSALNQAIADARSFFSERVPHPSKIEIVAVDDGIDITYAGIELGSYGIREHDRHCWLYATGVAEPRFSSAIALFP
jgi:hypothetical protein